MMDILIMSVTGRFTEPNYSNEKLYCNKKLQGQQLFFTSLDCNEPIMHPNHLDVHAHQLQLRRPPIK